MVGFRACHLLDFQLVEFSGGAERGPELGEQPGRAWIKDKHKLGGRQGLCSTGSGRNWDHVVLPSLACDSSHFLGLQLALSSIVVKIGIRSESVFEIVILPN